MSAKLPIDELGELFDMELDDDDVESVDGLRAKAGARARSSSAFPELLQK